MRKFVLVAVLLLTTTAIAQDSLPRFEVASVKPNTGSDLSMTFSPESPDGIRFTNHSLDSIIRAAYAVQGFRVIGMPSWAHDARYDIDARASKPIPEDERRLMLQALLIERFQLKAHFDTREQPAYVLTRARQDGQLGPGLTLRTDCTAATCRGSGSAYPAGGKLDLRGANLDALSRGMFSNLLGRVVRNESGVDGFFDVTLSWRPDASTDPADARPSFITAVDEQLGLNLSPERRMIELLIIDSVSRATAN